MPSGSADLVVEQEIVDSPSFDFATLADVTQVNNVLIGVGAASGQSYTAQLDLLDVQIWVPPLPLPA